MFDEKLKTGKCQSIVTEDFYGFNPVMINIDRARFNYRPYAVEARIKKKLLDRLMDGKKYVFRWLGHRAECLQQALITQHIFEYELLYLDPKDCEPGDCLYYPDIKPEISLEFRKFRRSVHGYYICIGNDYYGLYDDPRYHVFIDEIKEIPVSVFDIELED